MNGLQNVGASVDIYFPLKLLVVLVLTCLTLFILIICQAFEFYILKMKEAWSNVGNTLFEWDMQSCFWHSLILIFSLFYTWVYFWQVFLVYLQIHALAVSLSYFIYDSICCLFDSSISISNCIHHLVSVSGLGGGVMYAKVYTLSSFSCFMFDCDYYRSSKRREQESTNGGLHWTQ